MNRHLGKNGTIRELNQASRVRNNYVYYYVRKSSILLAGKGIRKISFLECKILALVKSMSEYLKSLISRINEVYVFFNKITL